MYKYDIPYPKEGQMTLTLDGIPINVSKKKSYLMEKMYAHRASVCEADGVCPATKYEIIEADGKVVFNKFFSEGEKVFSEEPYHKIKKEKVNYVSKNGFNLIADEEGKIITDEELMDVLYNLIYVCRLPISNSREVAVQLATYKPTTKDEFVSLKGLGEKKYDKCGEFLMDVIKKHSE